MPTTSGLSWILGKETKRRQQRSPPSLAHVAIEKPSLETASAFYSSMAIIMDDIDDEDGPGVNSLSTDELRKEVARLQSMLGENEPEDGEEEEEGEAAKGTVGHPADFDNPSFLNDVKLNYTNGDVYKGEAIEGIRNGRGLHQCSNGDIYDGEWKDDKRHGRGLLRYVSGLEYDGAWVIDKAEGQGVCKYVNGDKYEGEWKQDLRWGWGKQIFSDGDVYEGEWKNNAMDGNGRYTYADNSYFQGNFSEGMQVSGKYSSADGSLEYDGRWKGQMRHGQGTFHISGAYKYTGSWFENARHGKGKCVYSDGASYDGEWQNDERHGNGKYQDTEEVFEGMWKHDAKEGYGTSKSTSGGRYQGQWKHGAEDGNGKRLYPDGSVFEGQWTNGKRHGKGKFTDATTKEVYNGEWAKDMRHGYGVCSYADGTKFRGEWEDDCWLQSTADPTFTRVHGPGLSRGIAGEASVFVIEARDELKNKRMNGGDDFYVCFENSDTKESTFAEITDHDDGSYTVKFSTKVAGVYTCSVMIGADEHVADSPYVVKVLPDRPFPRRCCIKGKGYRVAELGAKACFSVEALDRFGNAVLGRISEYLPLDIKIVSSTNEICDFDIVETEAGHYFVTYTPTSVGYYRLTVESCGISIGESPYSLEVRVTSSPSSGENESAIEVIEGNIVSDPPPSDQVKLWEDIAQQEYLTLDGDDGGWASTDEDEKETEEERMTRENPDVPIITNLEDLYKIPRMQKALREQERKKKAVKLRQMRKRLEEMEDDDDAESKMPEKSITELD